MHRPFLMIATCAALLSPAYISPVAANPGGGAVGAAVVCAKTKVCRKVVSKVFKNATKKCNGTGSSGTANSTAQMCK